MKLRRLLALDRRPGKKGRKVQVKRLESGLLVVEPLGQGQWTNEPASGVLLTTSRDDHNHIGLYGLFDAAEPVALNETRKKRGEGGIFDLIRKRIADGPDGPIVALNYNMEAGVTAQELEAEFPQRTILLMSTSLHGGVASRDILERLPEKEGGEKKRNGEVHEDYFFASVGVVETMLGERLVDAMVEWMKKRIRQGTVSITEKAVFSPVQFRAIVEARRQLIQELGYDPVPKMYLFYPSFKGDLKRYQEIAEREGFELGVKWVADGGTTNMTAPLRAYEYRHPDRPKGIAATFPINIHDPKAVAVYLEELKAAGIKHQTIHAIGDATIGDALDVAREMMEGLGDLDVTFSHLQLPTTAQIEQLRRLAIDFGQRVAADMQPGYASEVHRYESLAHLLAMNPVKAIADVLGSRLTLGGTDGMPHSQLFGAGCAIGHARTSSRVSLTQFQEHSRDPTDPDGFVLVTTQTYWNVMDMKKPDVMHACANDMGATTAKLDGGILAVVGHGQTLHTSSSLDL